MVTVLLKCRKGKSMIFALTADSIERIIEIKSLCGLVYPSKKELVNYSR